MECFGLKIVILVNIGQLVGAYWGKDFELNTQSDAC
jgi:hypothetical protein